ncbi:MAG: methyltransferase [Desulfobacteraceae bacterium]|jgi:protein-S-isoprenylcysteine O-methyltransferase Ste14
MEPLSFKISSGWTISVLILIIYYVPMMFGKKEKIKQIIDYSFCTYGKLFLSVLWMGMFFPIVYGIFLDIDFGSASFYTGAVFMILGTVTYVVSIISYLGTPPDQPIIKGMYRISRNPLYVTGTVISIGMAFILHSWIIGISISVNVILQHFVILDEERFCAKKYGDSYLKFKEKIPRYLFF